MNGLKRGAFIVIEGVDRSGKSTQCKKLVESLNTKNVKAKLITFPDRSTNIGGIIDKYLKQENNLSDEAIHLMFAANRWEKRSEMENLLKQGYTLIVDRYSYSGIVYSSVKKNMNLKWCQQSEVGLLKPDKVFLLTLNEEMLAQRPNYGEERYETEETQKRVASAFMDLSKKENNWDIVEANGTIDQVHDVLLSKVLDKIKTINHESLDKLYFRSDSSPVVTLV